MEHYKAITKVEGDSIYWILALISETALHTVNPLPQQTNCIQVMLEKGKGPRIADLRIIQLLEAALNWVLKLIWG